MNGDLFADGKFGDCHNVIREICATLLYEDYLRDNIPQPIKKFIRGTKA